MHHSFMKSARKYMLTFLFLLRLATALQAQQILDSLIYTLKSHKKEDTVKLKLMNAVANEYQYSDPANGIKIADSAISLAKALRKDYYLAYGYMIKSEN